MDPKSEIGPTRLKEIGPQGQDEFKPPIFARAVSELGSGLLLTSSRGPLSIVQPEFEKMDFSKGAKKEDVEKIKKLAEKQPLILANGACWVWLATPKVCFSHTLDQTLQKHNHMNKAISVQNLIDLELIEDVYIRSGNEHLYFKKGNLFTRCAMNPTRTYAHLHHVWFDSNIVEIERLTRSGDFRDVLVGACWCGMYSWQMVRVWGPYGWAWYYVCASCGGYQ